MANWKRGVSEIRGLLVRGDLDRVVASTALANRLLTEATSNLKSATAILELDPGGSIQLAYEAARKAATSVLAVQGLRATTSGGHVAVQRAVIAQFGESFGQFGRMRRRRHQQEYPDPETPTATRRDVEEVIAFAEQAIETATQLLSGGKLSQWT